MFGLPFEAIEFIASGIIGAFGTIVATKMKMEAQRSELMIRGLVAQSNATIALNEQVNKSPFMAMTRRILALGVLAIMAIVMVGGWISPDTAVNVVREIKSGGSYLFGLIDTRSTEIVYESVKGIVVLPWFKHIALIVFGTYFGSSVVKV